jgi:Ca-activated chloride channel family protein
MVEVLAMKFLSPLWLWGILILPLIFGIILLDEKRRQTQFEKFANRKIWSRIVPELDFSLRVKKAGVWLVGLGFLLLALARPQFGSHEETVQVSGLDMMLVLDVSNSMEVEDVVPSRLRKSKHLIRSLVDRMEGDRIGVVAFAGSSYLACPLTSDLSYLLDTVQILGPKMIQNQGTDIGIALETALKAVERGAEEAGKSDTPNNSSKAIVLITDGEDHEGEGAKAAARIRESGIKLFVLGVGTTQGGPVPVRDESGNINGYKREKSGQPVVSRFNPDSLKKVASEGGGKYWDVSVSESEVNEILKDMGALQRTDYAERRYLVYEERFQIPLFIAILIFILELSVPSRKAVQFLFLFFMYGFLTSPSYAQGPLGSSTSLETYRENKKGIEAFEEGRLEDAQKRFNSAQGRDPSRPELEFNQGVVQLQQGETDPSIESFQKSARLAQEKQDVPLLGKSLYNLGQAFTKKGDVKNAVKSYLGAIHAAEQTKDQKLEEDSRKNIQLLMNEIKKQKQQQEQKSKQENQQKDKEQDKEQQKKDQEQKKEAKEGEKRYSNPKRQFKSQKMSPEDADRVMAELKSKERELQEKLNRQHGTPQNSQKDW